MSDETLSASGSGFVPLREGERRRVRVRCEARIGTAAWTLIFLQDLSTRGFQMSRVPGLQVGTRLRIKVPGLELLSANVRWVGERDAGCVFNRPLSDYVLDHFARRTAF